MLPLLLVNQNQSFNYPPNQNQNLNHNQNQHPSFPSLASLPSNDPSLPASLRPIRSLPRFLPHKNSFSPFNLLPPNNLPPFQNSLSSFPPPLSTPPVLPNSHSLEFSIHLPSISNLPTSSFSSPNSLFSHLSPIPNSLRPSTSLPINPNANPSPNSPPLLHLASDEPDGYEHPANKKKRKVPSAALQPGLVPSTLPSSSPLPPLANSELESESDHDHHHDHESESVSASASASVSVSDPDSDHNHRDNPQTRPPTLLTMPLYADPAVLAKGLSSHYVKMRKKPLGSPRHYGRRLARARRPPSTSFSVFPPFTSSPPPTIAKKNTPSDSLHPHQQPALPTPVLPNLYDPRLPLVPVFPSPSLSPPGPPSSASPTHACAAEFSFRLEIAELTARLTSLHLAINGAKQTRDLQLREAMRKVRPPVEPPLAPALGGKPAGVRKQQAKKGKKRRAAHANANNIHHRSNYVFSRLPAQPVPLSTKAIPALAPPRSFIDPTLSLYLDHGRLDGSATGHAQLGPSKLAQLLVEPEEWVCAFCEYALWFGDETSLRSLKRKLRGRRRRREVGERTARQTTGKVVGKKKKKSEKDVGKKDMHMVDGTPGRDSLARAAGVACKRNGTASRNATCRQPGMASFGSVRTHSVGTGGSGVGGAGGVT